MLNAFNPSTQEEEAGEWLCIRGQAGLHTEFQATQNYIIDSVSKTNQPNKHVSLSGSIPNNGSLLGLSNKVVGPYAC